MRIRWLRSGEIDTDCIVDHISLDDPVAARKVITRIDRAIEKLSLYPSARRNGRIFGTRELVVPRSPYIVVYAISDDEVVIVHVIHGAQLWPPDDD